MDFHRDNSISTLNVFQARIRFEDENGAKTAWEKAVEAGEGKVTLKESQLEGRVLEGG